MIMCAYRGYATSKPQPFLSTHRKYQNELGPEWRMSAPTQQTQPPCLRRRCCRDPRPAPRVPCWLRCGRGTSQKRKDKLPLVDMFTSRPRRSCKERLPMSVEVARVCCICKARKEGSHYWSRWNSPGGDYGSRIHNFNANARLWHALCDRHTIVGIDPCLPWSETKMCASPENAGSLLKNVIPCESSALRVQKRKRNARVLSP